jgi:hypothetical protein
LKKVTRSQGFSYGRSKALRNDHENRENGEKNWKESDAFFQTRSFMAESWKQRLTKTARLEERDRQKKRANQEGRFCLWNIPFMGIFTY